MRVYVKDIEYIIDEDDCDFFNSRKWSIDKDGYLFTHIKNDNGNWTTRRYHRLIMNVNDPKILVDHIDRDVKNNKKENLRLCNTQQNGFNRGNTKDSSSKYKGVSVVKNKLSTTYKTTITIDGKSTIVGRFDNEDIAGYVYNTYAKIHFGEFANLNDVREFTEEEIENSRRTTSKSNSNRYKAEV